MHIHRKPSNPEYIPPQQPEPYHPQSEPQHPQHPQPEPPHPHPHRPHFKPFRKIRSIGKVICWLFVLALGCTIAYGFWDANTGKNSTTSRLIAEHFEEIEEVAVYEYTYIHSETLDEDYMKIFNINIPWTNKHCTLTGSGTIKFGIDMNDADFTIQGNNIKVTIPTVSILSHELDEDSMEFSEQSDSIFNKLTAEDLQQLRSDFKTNVEENLNQPATSSTNSVYTTANNIVQKKIKSAIESLNSNYEVTVQFK
jgi:hypothetical protein